MAPAYSTLRCSDQHRESLHSWQAQQNLFPAIEFYPRSSKKDKENNTTKDGKSESVREFQVPLDLTDTNSKTYDYFIDTFDRGTPERYCNMREKVEGLAVKLGYTTKKDGETDDEFKERKAKHLTGLYSAVLDGFSLNVFEEKLQSTALASSGAYKKLREAHNAVAKTIFTDPEKAYTTQKKYLQ